MGVYDELIVERGALDNIDLPECVKEDIYSDTYQWYHIEAHAVFKLCKDGFVRYVEGTGMGGNFKYDGEIVETYYEPNYNDITDNINTIRFEFDTTHKLSEVYIMRGCFKDSQGYTLDTNWGYDPEEDDIKEEYCYRCSINYSCDKCFYKRRTFEDACETCANKESIYLDDIDFKDIVTYTKNHDISFKDRVPKELQKLDMWRIR